MVQRESGGSSEFSVCSKPGEFSVSSEPDTQAHVELYLLLSVQITLIALLGLLSSHVSTVCITSQPNFQRTYIPKNLRSMYIKLVEFVFVRMTTVNSQIVMLSRCNVQVVVCGFMNLVLRKVNQML